FEQRRNVGSSRNCNQQGIAPPRFTKLPIVHTTWSLSLSPSLRYRKWKIKPHRRTVINQFGAPKSWFCCRMGLPLSCPFGDHNDVDSGLESIIVKSISLGDDQVKTAKRSVSFNSRDSDPKILKSLGSGKMAVEGSISFTHSEMETLVSIIAPSSTEKEDMLCRSVSNMSLETLNQSPRSDVDLANPKHKAAVKLQKVYKSFRTRRKLADCAVLVEQSWWKLLDFAELKHSSISFFDIEHHETAISRWSRAKTRAAKVGKGLSKNDKAQKLALQHWLEAVSLILLSSTDISYSQSSILGFFLSNCLCNCDQIDPRHRYGHNLHFYYVKWLQSQSREPFFYWLDIGEGKEVNLEKCSRSKLQNQCIKYLGPIERLDYEVCVENGKLFYKESGEVLDTTTEPHAKWIFVLSTMKTLYVGKKKKGAFQHSSFLAGGATSAAGRLVVDNGNLTAVWPHSGHYRPTPENFQDFVSFLKENNVDLSDVKMDPVDEEESSFEKQRSCHHLRTNSSEDDLIPDIQLNNEESNIELLTEEKRSAKVQEMALIPQDQHSPRLSKIIPTIQLTHLLIPNRDELAVLDFSNANSESTQHDCASDDEVEANEDEEVAKESILKRINSHKEMRSYQLGKQLSCKWTSGAGPRISCVRDYPSELQFRALEQVNLSPRSLAQLKCTSSLQQGFKLSPKVASSPNTVFSEASFLPCRTRSSPLCEMIEDVKKHKVIWARYALCL
ncbi:hypothetical protein V2J09_001021, partial [Rumex salicifolius]